MGDPNPSNILSSTDKNKHIIASYLNTIKWKQNKNVYDSTSG